MNTIFENNHSVTMMIWETNPAKRNINNTVKLMVKNHKDIAVGDMILGRCNAEEFSAYIVNEVKSKRPAAAHKHDYYEVSCEWTSSRNSVRKTEFKKDVSVRLTNLFNW